MKLLHASDFHLDSPLTGLGAEKSALRRRELRELPSRLVKLARDEGVDGTPGGHGRQAAVRGLRP